MSRSPLVSGVVLAAVLGWLPQRAAAEDVTFVAGGRVQLPAVVEGETIRLDAPGGPVTFARDEVRSIAPSFVPDREWPARRDSALASDAQSRYEAAWWALTNGLTPEAESLLRASHATDPSHQPTARLVALLDRLTIPRHDPDLAALRRHLPGPWRLARGPHVVLFHQHDPADAAERVDLLERVTTTYYLALSAQGFDLALPARRLPSIWFARRDDYRAFLHARGADAFATTRGYYHPTLDLVAAYDSRDDGPRRRALIELEAQRRDGDPRRDDDRRRLLLDLDRRALDLGTAAHEMVHHLVACSGLAPRHDAFPLWLHEGLAAQFEVVRGGRWAGLGSPHALRLADWDAVQPAPCLLPLLRDEGFGRGYQAHRYAHAWSLVHYLQNMHPGRFVTFLDLLRGPSPDSLRGPDRTLAHFRAAFGDDLGVIESAWHRHAAALRGRASPPLRSTRSDSPLQLTVGAGPL